MAPMLGEASQCVTSKMLKHQNTEIFKYSCLTGFAYVYLVKTSLAGAGISFQNHLYIFKLLIMFDIQYCKRNNIFSA